MTPTNASNESPSAAGAAKPSRRIAVIVGSLRRESNNRKLADAIEKMLPAGYEAKRLPISEIPLYNQDHDADMSEPARAFKRGIESCDAVIFVTPEYDRSVPGVLKNAFDTASRPWGKSSWKGRPAGVIGASIGAAGTAMAQQHLRLMLAWADMPTLGQPEAFIHAKEGTFAADGTLAPEVAKFVQTWVDAYVAHVELHLGARERTAAAA